MSKLLTRLSLWHKIVGLITVLLSVMLLVAVYSHFKTLDANDEIQDLNAILLPVIKNLGKIEVHGLRQAIHYERAVSPKSGDAEKDRALRERSLAIFKSLGIQAEKQISAVTTLTEDALGKVTDVDDAVELARIQEKLKSIRDSHEAYQDAAIAILTSLDNAGLAVMAERMALLEKQQDRFFEGLALAIVRLDNFIIQQSEKVIRFGDERARLSWQLLAITISAFLLGTILAIIVTGRILEPIRSLRRSAASVAQGDLDVEVQPKTGDEVGQLAIAFNEMVKGLRDRENIKETFSRYVDPRVAGHLLSPGNQDSEGDRREMTVFFSDIEGFTTISEQLTPQALVKLINHYLAEMSVPIQDEDGIIDKFIGDAIMAYWGPPFVRDADQAMLGVRAGLACLERLALFQEQVPEIIGLRKGAPEIQIRIGIATGPVVIGNIGSRKMRNYTLMGDTVNLAARLEGACKSYGLRMLVSDTTASAVGDRVLLREIDAIAVKGKTEPSRIYEPLGLSSDVDPAQEQLRETYEKGLAAYRAQDWAKARRAFRQCPEIAAGDKPSAVFLDRIAALEQAPPGDDWDGVWRMTSK